MSPQRWYQRRRAARAAARRRSVCRSSCWPAPPASIASSPAPHPEDRPRARRLPRISEAGPRADLRRERDPLSREPRSRGARRGAAARAHARLPVRRHHWRVHAAERAVAEAERAGLPLLKTAVATPTAIAKLSVDPRRLASPNGRCMHAVLLDILGLGRAHHRRERHRQERVRARSDRPRPSAGRRRHRGNPAPGRDHPDRHLPRADAASHGAARARRHQRQGAVRHRVDAILEARRARRAARALGVRRANTSGWDSTTSFYEILGLAGPAHPDAGRARPQRRDSRGSRRPESAAACPRPSRGAGARRAPRADPARRTAVPAPTTTRTTSWSRESRDDEAVARRSAGGTAWTAEASPEEVGRSRSSSSPGCPDRESRRRFARSRISGYFCVDNLPTTLIPTLAKLSLRAGAGIEKVAIVVDVREGELSLVVPDGVPALRKMPRLNPVLIFLEASDAALVRRFSETRRPASAGAGPLGQRRHPRRAQRA